MSKASLEASNIPLVLNADIGTKTKIRIPSGTFNVVKTENQKKVFIATGTGITPFFSIINELSKNNPRLKLNLLWGIRHENEDFSSMYLQDLLRTEQLEKTLCLSAPMNQNETFYCGRVTDKLHESNIDFAKSDFYICGNPTMVYNVQQFLYLKGATNIYFEV